MVCTVDVGSIGRITNKFLSCDFGVCLCVFIVLIKIHIYVLSRKDWVLSETGVTLLILHGNVPICIFGKILFTALVCYCFLDKLNPKILKRN
jgi:hypothetical protein